jgi:hypothetical protein
MLIIRPDCRYGIQWLHIFILYVLLKNAVFRIRDILEQAGSGTGDPYHLLTDPDPALFVSNLQDANRKIIFFLLRLFAY